jgi:hypothetical protein
VIENCADCDRILDGTQQAEAPPAAWAGQTSMSKARRMRFAQAQ